MPMTTDQLRAAFEKLNGQRTVRMAFERSDSCTIKNALLVPVESDQLIKLTDGVREYVVDASRVVWIEIG